ncbi:peptidoglycan editing factor PgeF [Cognatilysobacter lacus]|uniref:Purine nucleoside phosphorylase n=1 Tax=Cognatilysobacter lacus TaxID=1643323 RepID=A0A5D8Z7K1_9GAMM|nr:peptidoglycan editing factor PgeF [Lysobacter lacus]TZF90868.1 peptidoglycan editing factor PgeF [Lysobacter lacus]
MSPFLHAQWPAPPGVHGLTTLRHGAGNSRAPFDTFNLGNRYAADGDEPAVVEANRAELVAKASLPSAPRWLRQVHGTRVLRMHAGTATDPEPEADAAVTSDAGVVIAILTADCLPVLFAARDGSEVAGAHAGWRGLADGVLEATLAAMRTSAGDVVAWLGPAAGPQHYEVGVDVYDAFVARDWRSGAAFVTTRPHHWRVDLHALARLRLADAGMAPDAIHGGGLCTIAEPTRFFSHRRDRRTGRMASLVWIEPRR